MVSFTQRFQIVKDRKKEIFHEPCVFPYNETGPAHWCYSHCAAGHFVPREEIVLIVMEKTRCVEKDSVFFRCKQVVPGGQSGTFLFLQKKRSVQRKKENHMP